MKTQRAPFRPLESDVADDKLEALAQKKGVGVYIRPEAENSDNEQGVRTEQRPMPPEADEVPLTGATPRSRMKAVTIELPEYVWTDLKIRAARQKTSLRHVIMTALVRDDVTIADADMVEDGRRLRGRNAIPAN